MDTEKALMESVGGNIERKKIRLGKYLINYVVSGRGKPLILIHGADFGWGQWYKVIPELSKKFKVYAFDLPGSGRSTMIDYNSIDIASEFCKVTKRFIEKLKLKRPIILGHSIGGWVALRYSVDTNASLCQTILVNPLGFSSGVPNMYKLISFYPFARFLSRTLAKPSSRFVESFLKSAVIDKNSIESLLIDYYLENLENGGSHPLLLMSQISGFNRVNDQFLFLENDLRKVSNPVSIIVGDSDPMTSVIDIENSIRGCDKYRLMPMKKSSHIPFVEKPTEFSNSVLSLLQ